MPILTRNPTSNTTPDPGQGAIADTVVRRLTSNQSPDPGQGPIVDQVVRRLTSNQSPDPGQGAIADQVVRRTTANQTPDPGQGGTAVTGPLNTGHGSTTASSSGGGDSIKTCLWSGFQSAGVTPASVTLKIDFSRNGSFDALGGNNFFIDYSLDNGASWNFLRSDSNVSGLATGTDQAALSTGQNLTQVRVRDFIEGFSDPGGNGSMTASISNIRLELGANIQAQAVSSPTNTGHGPTIVSSNNDVLSYKTCVWSGFAAAGVTPSLVRLRVDWNQNGALSGAGATNSFRIEYSTNNGASWSILRDVSNINGSSGGTSEVTLSNGQDLTQVRVRVRYLADAPEGSSASLTISISDIRIDIDASIAGQAVSGAANNGHGATSVSSNNGVLAYKTCFWSGFAAAAITPSLVRLRVDWSQSGSVTGAGATNSFRIEFSTNGGSTWSILRDVSNINGASGGTSEVTLSNGQNLTQVRVRVRYLADAPEGSSASLTVSISDIRIDIDASIIGVAVSTPTNTGHGPTVASSNNGVLAYRTCLWSGFQPSGVSPTEIKLKTDWSHNGSLAGLGATNSYRIEYSLNNGSTWLTLREVANVNGLSNGTSEVALSNDQNFTLVRVRTRLLADAPEGSSASLTVTLSAIRIEVEYNPAQLIVMM